MNSTNNTSVISEIEIDPNQLRKYSKLPLPEFAIKALSDNGFAYNNVSAPAGFTEHDLQLESNKCKLSKHIQSIESHINKDGPRLWPSGTYSNVGDEFSSQSASGNPNSN